MRISAWSSDVCSSDLKTLSALNPRLIVCSITGYGRNNAHSDRPAIDALVQARTGLMFGQRGWAEGALSHMNGEPDPFPALEIPQEDVQGAPRAGPLMIIRVWHGGMSFHGGLLGVQIGSAHV